MHLTRASVAASFGTFVVICAFAGTLAHYYVPAFQRDGTDQSALLRTAASLATSDTALLHQSDPLAFVSEQYLEVGDSVFAAKYGIGYPLVCALAYRLFGPTGPFLVNPLLAVLGLIGIFLLGREIAGASVGALATLIVACDPVYTAFSLSAMTHTMAAVCGVWAMYFLWRWATGAGRVSAFLCGVLVAAAASARFSEALLFIPVVFVASRTLVVRGRGWRRRWSGALLLILGALLAGLPVMLHHWLVFGSPFVTGYSLTSEATAFGWEWFSAHLGPLIQNLGESGFLPVAGLGLAAMLVLRPPFTAFFFAAWALPILVLNCAYYSRTASLGDLRLFMTAFAPLALAASTFLFSASIPPRWQARAVALLLLAVVPWALSVSARCVDAQRSHLQASVDFEAEIRASVPPGSVLWSRQRLLYFIDYRGGFDLFNAGWFEDEAVRMARSLIDDPREPTCLQRQRLLRIVEIGEPSGRGLRVRSVVSDQLKSGKRVFFVDSAGSPTTPTSVFLGELESVPVRQWSLRERYCDGTSGSRSYALYEILGPSPAAGPENCLVNECVSEPPRENS